MDTTTETIDCDVVVVGARCAGAATALLAARAGLQVVVLERAPAGSDTVSTHALMRAGVSELQRWGLLDAVVAAGTPAVRRTAFHYGPDAVRVTLKPVAGVDAVYAPRRTVLDALLVRAAADAGADVRFGVSVRRVLRAGDGRAAGVSARTGDGRRLDVRARWVVGADGVGSVVARAVDAEVVHRGTGASGVVYGRWADVDDDGYEWFYGTGLSAGIIPTNGGEVCVFASGPPARVRAALAGDARGGFRRLLDAAAPGLTTRLAAGRAPVAQRAAYGVPGFTRQAWGPGWALVGDAGYWKDPVTAHGMTDALRDAELLARALVAAAGGADEADALGGYERERDRLSVGVRDVTDAIARYDWGLADVHRLLLDLSSAMSAEVEALLALGPLPPAAPVRLLA